MRSRMASALNKSKQFRVLLQRGRVPAPGSTCDPVSAMLVVVLGVFQVAGGDRGCGTMHGPTELFTKLNDQEFFW